MTPQLPDPAVAPLGDSDDPAFTELLKDLASEVATLVRQELALAAAEMAEKARAAVRNTILIAVGGMLGAVSLLVLTGAIVLALGSVVPMWASAFVLATLIAAACFVACRRGAAALKSMTLVPIETFASLKVDEAWVKDQIVATRAQMTTTLGEVRRRLEVPPEPPAKPKKRRAPTKRKTAP